MERATRATETVSQTANVAAVEVKSELREDGRPEVASLGDGRVPRPALATTSIPPPQPPKPAQQDEVDKLIGEDLPGAVDVFQAAYGQLKERGDVLTGDPVRLEPAQRLLHVGAHLRDLSWRRLLSSSQAAQLGNAFVRLLPTLQTVLAIAKSLDFQSALAKGDKLMLTRIAAAFEVGLGAASSYCTLAGAYGMPLAVDVEDIGIATVQCLKRCLAQVIEPYLSPKEGSKKKADMLIDFKHFMDLRNASAALMRDLHEFLCRHGLPDDQLHQLVHMGLTTFFYADPDFTLCAAAEDLLVTIFGRFDGMRSSLVQEFLVRVPKLPIGKRIKQFKLQVTVDNPAFGLSLSTHLLLRLIQSMCLPLREQLGGKATFEALLVMRSMAQMILRQLAGGMVQRLLVGRAKGEELRLAFDNLLDELLTVMFMPPWPGALALVRVLTQQLVALISEKPKVKMKTILDSSVRDSAIKLLGKVVENLSRHHAEATRCFVKLPRWDEKPDQTSKDERTLQHVALRISLEEGTRMPWTDAARAVDAWDAELFVAHSNEDHSGLASLTDDYVFRYLTLSHLEEQRIGAARVPPSGATAQLSLSASVFASGHAIHAWSFMVCDWSDIALRQKKNRGKDHPVEMEDDIEDGEDPETARMEAVKAAAQVPLNKEARVMEAFLTTAWTSQTPVCGEGAGSLSGGSGRRVVLKFTVYKVYRQLCMLELESLRRWALGSLVVQAHSVQATLRKTAMRAISDAIDADGDILKQKAVEETIDMRLRDESAWVRQVSLDVLGRVLEGSINNNEHGDRGAAAQQDADGVPEALLLDRQQGGAQAASAMLLRFHQTLRGRINDTSVLVRRQAARILSAFVLNHPEHPDVVEVCLDLLRRSTDSELLRNQMLSTFELLWFVDDEPSAKASAQLARVVDAARSMDTGTGATDLLNQLLLRYQKNTNSKKRANSFEHGIRRWTTLLLTQYVELNADSARRRAAQKRSLTLVSSATTLQHDADSRWHLRRSLLMALEAFALAQPKHMVVHLRPLTVYLALEEDSPPEEQWVAQKVCQILSAVLPYVADRRGLMDHRQVQQDLQTLIKNQGSAGVHEAVRCLCMVVTYVTGDLAQLVAHFNVAVPALVQLCSLWESAPGSLERIQQMYMSRQVWVLASIMENLNLDEYIGDSDPDAARTKRIPRSSLRFEFVSGTVAHTIAELLVRIYALRQPQLNAVITTCLGFFLRGQRTFVKDRRIADIFKDALTCGDLGILNKALGAMASLLAFYGAEADKETRVNGREFDKNSSKGGSTAAKPTMSAVESAQPLAQFSDDVLAHITPCGRLNLWHASNANCEDDVRRIRLEALAVIRSLHQQGLVNPMVILPKVFALCFTGDMALSQQSTIMLKEVLELKPTLLLNRIDEAFREAFLSLFADPRPIRLSTAFQNVLFGPLSEIYTDRFRKLRATREAFIRKVLSELFTMRSERFKERFGRLPLPASRGGAEDLDGVLVPPRRLKIAGIQERQDVDEDGVFASLQGLPGLQFYQLLYAQFVCAAIMALPFHYENEPLLVVFECNRHLSLHVGTLSACEEQEQGACEGEKAQKEPPSKKRRGAGAAVPDADAKELVVIEDEDELDFFSEAISILACVCLKNSVKSEYALSDELCAQFNPKAAASERLKSMWGAFKTHQPPDSGDTVRFKLDMREWMRLAAPLAGMKSRSDFAAYAGDLSEIDLGGECSRGQDKEAEKPERPEAKIAAQRGTACRGRADAEKVAQGEVAPLHGKAKAGGARRKLQLKRAQAQPEEEERPAGAAKGAKRKLRLTKAPVQAVVEEEEEEDEEQSEQADDIECDEHSD